MYREYLSCKRENGTRGSPHYTFFYTFLSISILIFVRVISTFSIIFIFKKCLRPILLCHRDTCMFIYIVSCLVFVPRKLWLSDSHVSLEQWTNFYHEKKKWSLVSDDRILLPNVEHGHALSSVMTVSCN